MHPQIEPSNIVYQLTDGPYHGWLEITTTPGTLELENYNEEPVHTKLFDQSIINANRLVYVQSGVNRTRDRIRMDVTNGIVWLRDVELNVVIIPEHFYVVASNLTVVEGEAVSVKPDLFRTVTKFYRGKIVAYKVVEKPKFGKIVMTDQELNLLPVLKLNSGNIQIGKYCGCELYKRTRLKTAPECKLIERLILQATYFERILKENRRARFQCFFCNLFHCYIL